MYVGARAMACLGISEDNSWELVLSLHQVGPGYQTQVIRLCGKHLYLLNLEEKF